MFRIDGFENPGLFWDQEYQPGNVPLFTLLGQFNQKPLINQEGGGPSCPS